MQNECYFVAAFLIWFLIDDKKTISLDLINFTFRSIDDVVLILNIPQ